MNNDLITREGYQLLLKKFEGLQGKLKLAQKEVSEAMADGDFREDSKYSIALEERSKIENSVDKLNAIIESAKIVIPDFSSDNITFGRSAKVQNIDTESIQVFTVVGTNESDPKVGKISYASPFGRAMLGLAEGDTFEVVTHKKETSWEVLEVLGA
tara:strand:- start:2458 stop:2925 length:468 start_codon:yes stop_codon:yes gene_type:complete